MYCDPLDMFCFLQEHISINCLLPIRNKGLHVRLSANEVIFMIALLPCKVCMACLRNARSWFAECMSSVCDTIWLVPCFLFESINVK
ncbi:hypothetical protein PAHAL_4G246500 [Panicum hallii]|uniref:Uncharacterized protein n=1 Tax=Panicum hallii TaxID=206008 RepID=A0A2S3HLM6_9POAL|nr:hypothetical protein PAHAL_4G246500 [Panicum hallii]